VSEHRRGGSTTSEKDGHFEFATSGSDFRIDFRGVRAMNETSRPWLILLYRFGFCSGWIGGAASSSKPLRLL
jgi:hypothetical protein